MRLQGKRILVTGGAGFIGSHLAEDLSHDNEVTVLDDFSVGRESNLADFMGRVRVIRYDITDTSRLTSIMRSIDVVFHLAVVCLRVSIPDPVRSHMVNDVGTLNLLMAARHIGVDRFIYCSSSEVYGTAMYEPMHEDHPLNPMTPYAAAKLGGEATALSFRRTYGLPVTVVRPFNTYGPRAHVEGPSGELIPKFVARAFAGRPLIVFGDGQQTRDYTWVGDTVRGLRLAAESDELLGQAVNIAHGEEVSVLQIAALVEKTTGVPVTVEHRHDRPGDVRRHIAGVDKAARVLGFRAQVGIEEGMQRYVEWFRSQPGDAESWIASEQAVGWERPVGVA